jgi:hypothetical protein
MSVVDRAIQQLQVPPDPRPITLSLPEAAAAVLVAAISADGTFGVDEANRLNSVLSTSRLFDQAVRAGDVDVVERAVNLLSERGVAPMLAACAAAIPRELRATVFAVATDLVLSDGRLEGHEKVFVDQLQSALQVDDGTALKIVEVLLIKNRT